MKRYLFIISIFCFITNANAQDRIIKNTGDTLSVKIVKSTDDAVSFIYPNEDVVNELYKNSISEIIYSSGRTEKVATKTNLQPVNGPDDWEKVQVTYNTDDVKGLEKLKSLSKSSLWGGALGSNAGYNDVIKKLKKEAAKNKCRVVLINDNPSKESAARGGGVKLNATIYR